ncbi:MAG: phenylalanine--tRNA ligase subunit beta [Candidatus Gracilibacteria bacterium]|nr:phenylalanine--tRNA ligase subunit beta [Candidatus Gracilibacteria bacterium]MDD5179152.1 phenylalanine--tRNA ligase subunit beta [Candidatus Gracilibacteria bacterium]
MKLSLNWISDFVETRGVKPEKLAALLTERVAEIEHTVKFSCEIPLVVTGKILKIEAIPEADKIRLTTVNVGKEKLQIICGAKNIYEGAVVPIALVGCELPGGFKIEKRKMRGIESNGMICSEKELGLAEASEGIWLLPEETKIGVPLSEAFPGDTVFEIDNHAITHRADLFGQYGLAREVAALLQKPFTKLKLTAPKFDGKLKVKVEAKTKCLRYCAIKITGVEVKPSPEKIRARLEACGIRAINNIVDATNYVMLELGQPLHAFDARNVAGEEIIVRNAKPGEKFTTLDEVERNLTPEMLVIADKQEASALAGIMGGKNSGIADSTTEIILESANFEAAGIRRTSIALGLRSESSLRFEKRLDLELAPHAAARFIQILKLTCPNLKLGKGADIKNFKAEKRVVKLPLAEIEKKLGVKIPTKQIQQILTALEFAVTKSKDGFTVKIPSFRAGRDVSTPADLIEEIGRIIGYSDLKTAFPVVALASPERDFSRELATEMRAALVGFGFFETCAVALVSAASLQKVGEDLNQVVSITNPPSEDYKYLRNNLLISLLETAQRNTRNAKSFRLFEISTVFAKPAAEKQVASALLVGGENPFAALSAVVEGLFTALRFPAEFQPTTEFSKTAHPGRVAAIVIAGEKIGEIAELHPAIAKEFELPRSAYLNLDFDKLAQLPRGVVLAKSLPRFPGVPRDIAVLVSSKTLAKDVRVAIEDADSKVCEVKLFDTYTGEGIVSGFKSLAFSFEIRDNEKTLSDAESEIVMQKIVANLAKIGGKLRA